MEVQIQKTNEVFETLKPIFDSYIERKFELQKQIAQDGILPDDIIAECPIHEIVEIKKYDEKTQQTVPYLFDWIKENKISHIESDTKKIYLKSTKKRIGGKSGSETRDSLVLYRDEGLKERVPEYEFRQPVKNYKKKKFYKLLTNHSYDNLLLCEHTDGSKVQEMRPVVVVSQDENQHRFHTFSSIHGSKSIGEALYKEESESNLRLLCDDCYKRIDKLCCNNVIAKKSMGYELDHTHNLDDTLLKLVLKKHNVKFNEFAEEYGGGSLGRLGNQFFLKDFNVLITRNHKDIEKSITKLNPETIILQGQKKDIIDLLKYDTNLIIFDDTEDAKQRYFLFDKARKVEKNIEKCCLSIIQNLEQFSEEIRGKEHDKLIGALERIGKDLGFITQREVVSKGFRVDLIWLDRNGDIFSSLEVETKAEWKKDVVTTWETESKLAVIISHAKTEKAIKDITQYVLLKDMPHKLLFINNITKKAYLVEKQNVLKFYDIEKKEEVESEVFEY